MQLFEITVRARFLVLANDKKEAIFRAEQATEGANAEMPRGVPLVCEVYETPNQTRELKATAINFSEH